jgi:hypothetical protein
VERAVLAVGAPALAGDHHDVAVLEGAVDDEHGSAVEVRAFDLRVELDLAGGGAVTVDAPHHVIGEAAEDGGVVARPEPVHVGVDDRALVGHAAQASGSGARPAAA